MEITAQNPTVQVHDRVRVMGLNEIFKVVHVNVSPRWADLACLERVGFVCQVPLDQILLVEAGAV